MRMLVVRWFSLAALVLAPSVSWAALKPGDAAPPFTLQAAKGGKVFTFNLADALKKGPVVVYFYPKSFTSVCTLEAHEFAESMPKFEKEGASVIGISADGIDTQREFSSKECRDTFPVGADPKFGVVRAYDDALTVPGTNIGFAERVSYVISPEGKILSTFASSEAEGHIEHALDSVRAWRAAHQH